MGDQHPGVFIDELPGPPHRIEGVPTSIAGFIGMTEAPFENAHVHSWEEYLRRWPEGSPVADAVEAHFGNGGADAWICPVNRVGPKAVRRAIEAMDRDVDLIAILAEPAASPQVIRAAAEALAGRRAMLLVEGPWPDAPSALAGMSADPVRAVGAEGADVAVYWPRLRRDRSGTVLEISPLGPVAGMIARTDSLRGVHIAPAGAGAALYGGLEPVATPTPAEQEALQEVSVNLVRTLPHGGTVVWGARTQSGDAEWKYVPVRRTLLFLEASIDRGLEWVAFEPNGPALWSAVRRLVQDFLQRMWQQGALQGTTPDEAFFVSCDRTTMTQNDLDDGRLVCSIGVAPVRAAEFVIFSIGRWTADADE